MPERPPDGFAFGRIKPYVWGPALAIIATISFYLIKNNFYSQLSTRTVQSVNKTSAPSSSDKNAAKENVQEGTQGETTEEKDSRENRSAVESGNNGNLSGTASAAANSHKSGTSHSLNDDVISGKVASQTTSRETEYCG